MLNMFPSVLLLAKPSPSLSVSQVTFVSYEIMIISETFDMLIRQQYNTTTIFKSLSVHQLLLPMHKSNCWDQARVEPVSCIAIE